MGLLGGITIVLLVQLIQINAQYGGGGGGGYGGGRGGYGGGYGGEGYGGGGYGYGEKKFLKPAVIKPPIIPYVKPVVTSYQKYPSFGGYGHGYGGYGHGGKVIPITKLTEFQPKFDITPFIKSYEGAHLLQKHHKPELIVKNAPPVFIRQPPIEKTIIQNVYVKQPVIVKEQPVIHKEKEIIVKKKPAIVKINEKAPVDVKDFGQTAVVKGVKSEYGGGGGKYEGGEGFGGEGGRGGGEGFGGGRGGGEGFGGEGGRGGEGKRGGGEGGREGYGGGREEIQ
ncbi:probable H/ACA ribonucleoprotein complex subunit 1 [Oppia nitens]|uniref:probable H/ACA ribonucleoprotein complex subunit 1 n=1 Tax=Oppia nitens TaxID=1686743 RepID=UPI0023DA6CA6|nr:probable H/ACA ribonucleoprotein complex subunit 1 [Oppia nitens]